MSLNLINSKDIIPASQIIDFFNGNYMFYVENPYFDVKGMSKINKNNFLQYKEITNGVQLIEPKIYAKINGKNGVTKQISKFRYYGSVTLFSGVMLSFAVNTYLYESKLLNITRNGCLSYLKSRAK